MAHSTKNKTNTDALHIVLGFDQNFWPPAFATMRSTCLCSLRRKDIIFHCLVEGLQDDAHKAFESLREEFGCQFEFYDIGANEAYDEITQWGEIWGFLTRATFARMLIDQYLPRDAQRVLYLDSDIFVRAPIEELMQTDLQGNSIGAVRAPNFMHQLREKDFKLTQNLIDFNQPFFNAGVILIDLEKWRKRDVISAVWDIAKEHPKLRKRDDQFLLNAIFAFDWLGLSKDWNMFGRGDLSGHDPYIVHYIGRKKPFGIRQIRPFARDYRYAMTNDVFFHFMRMRWRRKLRKWLPWLGQ